MKKRRYVLLAKAKKELHEKAGYLDQNASEATMLRFIRAVFATVSFLADFPFIGTKCILDERKPTLRRFPVSGFPRTYVFYTTGTRVLRITRIIDADQDWPRFFQ